MSLSEWSVLLVGVAIVLYFSWDAIASALSLESGGGMSDLAAKLAGLPMMMLTRKFHWLRPAVGPVVLLTVITTWVTGITLGWWIIFSASPEMVVSASDEIPATLAERLYFAGYNASTLGLGDFIPGTNLARFFTVLSGTSGFFIFTVSITLVSPVLSAVVSGRTLAGELADIMGQSDRGKLVQQRRFHIHSQLLKHGRTLRAYPAVGYFQSDESKYALEPSLLSLYRLLEREGQTDGLITEGIRAVVGVWSGVSANENLEEQLVKACDRCGWDTDDDPAAGESVSAAHPENSAE